MNNFCVVWFECNEDRIEGGVNFNKIIFLFKVGRRSISCVVESEFKFKFFCLCRLYIKVNFLFCNSCKREKGMIFFCFYLEMVDFVIES